MLSPNDGSRIVLLPEDKQLMELAGWTEKEYREFVRVARGKSRIAPGTPVAALAPAAVASGGNPFVFAGLLILGAALSFTASYLTRTRPKQSFIGGPRISNDQLQGQNIVSGARFAPKAGFDSLQNVVELGSVVPLVYAKREVIEGVTYGGIRINTNLLWSQVLSLGGDQLFRGIFLVGEGDDRANAMELDPEQFALGNNLLGSYNLNVSDTSRVSIYYSDDGGRLLRGDHIAGRRPASDPGAAPGDDVFQVRGDGGVWGTNFSYAYKPSTQTSFGLFNWIGNGMCFRINPELRPQFRVATRPLGNGNIRVVCDDDSQANVRRQKQNELFSGQSGITAGNTSLAVGDTVTYRLDPAVSFSGTFEHTSTATFGAKTATLTANDVNNSVSGRQKSFDQNIVLGELYKIGSAICVCTARTAGIFASAAENGNQAVEATFECVREGVMSPPPGTGGTSNATRTSQIFRIARGSFVTEYPTEVLELGIRSTVGIQVNGLTNTIEGGFTYSNIDAQSCPAPPAVPGNFPELSPDATIASQQYNAGFVRTSEERTSYFRLMFRVAGTEDEFTSLDEVFGIRSETNQPTYNYIRLEMPELRRYEFQMEPISGWEVRNLAVNSSFRILDHRFTNEQFVENKGVTIRYRGYADLRGVNAFRMVWVDPLETALEWDDQSMADSHARIAEAFCYDEITSSVGGNPEHEIVYINTILPNPVPPDYDNLAIVGMNIRASREFANLSQFSVYMNSGLGNFHDFPSVLRDILINKRYGVGEIVSPQQIDEESFTAATLYTNSRFYFFDGTISEPINLRQWGADMARNFLLDLLISNGRFSLQPLLQFSKPEDITGMFTAGNILEDSFELSYYDQDQRQPPRVAVKWRQEQTSGDIQNRGLFPIVRQVMVRESTTPSIAPIEQIDISDFCTSERHAIDRAKFECRFRRLSTHSVKFTTTADQASLRLGKCFRLGMETLTYDQPRNGYIARDGTITSWPELADGSYVVVAWNGNDYVETEIQVANGTSNRARGSVFCVADNVFQTQTYKVQSLSFNEEGNIDVEAIHWPTDPSGNSDLTAGWDDPANWVIEGELN